MDAWFKWVSFIISSPSATILSSLFGYIVALISFVGNITQALIVREYRSKLEAESLKLEKQAAKLKRLKDAIETSEGEIWKTYTANIPGQLPQLLNQNKPLIITIANLKGGVGKTSLVANLAAYFKANSAYNTNRVLMIDLDYQGSLSNTLFSAANIGDINQTENAAHILDKNANGQTVLDNTISFNGNLSGCGFIPTFYEFANFENRLMVDWLLGELEDDLRFRLFHTLLTPHVQLSYDIILIDTPPRLTVGTVNALCSSTHFIVPTILDGLSGDAVHTFIRMVKNNIRPLNPSLKLLGVVGSMTHQEPSLMGWEENAKNDINAQMEWVPAMPVLDRYIPRRAAIASNAGEDIAYFVDQDVQHVFNQLGREIEGRIWGNNHG